MEDDRVANALDIIYGNTLPPIPQVVGILEKETNPKRVADFVRRLEAVKKIDSDNSERRNYFGELAIWSRRRLGQLIIEGQERGTIATAGQPAKELSHDTTILSVEEVAGSRDASSRAKQLAELEPEQIAKYVAEAKESQDEVSFAGLIRSVKQPHVANNSGDNEWYTPQEIVDAARKVMGGIDVDPASSDAANEIIKARKFYSCDNSGLAESAHWVGNVWMNPPYASALIREFVDKFVHERECGHINQAIVLVNNATDSAWFCSLADISRAVCFSRGRIKFWKPEGGPSAPLQGQAMLYLGGRVKSFAKEFAKFGTLWFRHSTR